MLKNKIKKNNAFSLLGMAISLIIMCVVAYFSMKIYFKPIPDKKGEGPQYFKQEVTYSSSSPTIIDKAQDKVDEINQRARMQEELIQKIK